MSQAPLSQNKHFIRGLLPATTVAANLLAVVESRCGTASEQLAQLRDAKRASKSGSNHIKPPAGLQLALAVELSAGMTAAVFRLVSQLGAAYRSDAEHSSFAEYVQHLLQHPDAAPSKELSEFAAADRLRALRMHALVVATNVLRVNVEHLLAWNVPATDVGFVAPAQPSTESNKEVAVAGDDATAAGEGTGAGLGAGAGAGAAVEEQSIVAWRSRRQRRLDAAQSVTGGMEAPRATHFVELLNTLLQHTAQGSTVAGLAMRTLRETISATLSVGMPVFCASSRDRLEVLGALLRDFLAAGVSGASAATAAATTSATTASATTSDEQQLRQLMMARYFSATAEPVHVVALLSVVKSAVPAADAAGAGAAIAAATAATTATGLGDADLEQLLDNALTIILQYTETAVLNLLHSGSDEAQSRPAATGVQPPPHIKALREFLVRCQTVILSRALEDPSPTNPFYV